MAVWPEQTETVPFIISTHTHHCRLHWTARVYGHFRRVKMVSSRETATFKFLRKRRSRHVNAPVKNDLTNASKLWFRLVYQVYEDRYSWTRSFIQTPPSPAQQGLKSGDHTDHYQLPWNRCGKLTGMAVDLHLVKACGRFGNTVTLILNLGNEFIELSASRPSRITPERYPLHRRLALVGPTAETSVLKKAGNVEASWNGMTHAQKPHFVFRAKRTSPFKSAGVSVQSTTGSRGVRISGSNAGYTMFRGSGKGTGYPLHSPVSPSLPIPCVTACHHISTGVYV